MNALTLLSRVDAARERFEMEIARILNAASAEQNEIAKQIADRWNHNGHSSGRSSISPTTTRTKHKKRDGRAHNHMKGRHYAKGTHWTQKPENRAKLVKVSRLAHKARIKNGKAQKAA